MDKTLKQGETVSGLFRGVKSYAAETPAGPERPTFLTLEAEDGAEIRIMGDDTLGAQIRALNPRRGQHVTVVRTEAEEWSGGIAYHVAIHQK